MPEDDLRNKGLAGIVADNRHLKGDYWLLDIIMKRHLDPPCPGRFLMLKVSSSSDPLLRRPFGIHDCIVDGEGRERIKILYQVRGRGTSLMTRFSKGDDIDMLGPLGVGFETGGLDSRAVIVAGGIGGAPLLYLARRMVESGQKPRIYAGGGGEDDILGGREFRKMGLEMSCATIDGSVGYKGTVVDLLLEHENRKSDNLTVFACGPWGMLSALAGACRENGWSMQATVDSYMACGMGLCLGCAVRAAQERGDGKYVMVCRDGPVFHLEDIDWDNPTCR